ncbi:MAG: PrgI family protein [Patescibacteria group bacterium]|nr:PrgI family protein [Patescibacteria group bacterium]
MQFQVPQFIETEDKIVGPLTLRQFMYLAIAGLLVFLSFFVLQTWLWLIVVAVLGGSAAAMAFIQINGRSMVVFIMNAFVYLWEPHSYTYAEERIIVTTTATTPIAAVPPVREIKPPAPQPTAAPEREEAVPMPTTPPAPATTTPAPAPTPITPPAQAPSVTPKAVSRPAYAPAKAAAEAAERAVTGGLKDLWSKLQTTKSAIPHREKPLAGEVRDQDEIQEKYEVIRKITGESQLAKRVDYK